MDRLTAAAEGIDRALDALEEDGSGAPPVLEHRLRARAHLLEAKAEIGRALQAAALKARRAQGSRTSSTPDGPA